MGSQQRNVNLANKSGGNYGMKNRTIKTEFNPYQKYMNEIHGIKKKNKKKGKKK